MFPSHDRILLGAGGSSSPDVELKRGAANRLDLSDGDTFRVQGTWDGGLIRWGNNYVWFDASGVMRTKTSAPTSDTDGTVIGTQT